MRPPIKIALVGAGMFGGDVHARAYADLQRFGISGQLARVGLDHWTRDFAPVKFELAAGATRSQASAKKVRTASARRLMPRRIWRSRWKLAPAPSSGWRAAILSVMSGRTGRI